MRLPDFSTDPELNALRAKIGAVDLGTVQLAPQSRRLSPNQLQELITTGIDIAGLSQVRPLHDGTLAYRDRRVLVYDRELANQGANVAGEGDFARFHVANCNQLRDMRAKPSGRYVVSAQKDLIHKHLRACQECLEILGYEGNQSIAHAFTVEHFFHLWPRDLDENDASDLEAAAKLDDFGGDHGEHAEAAKQAANYRCCKCGVDLNAPELRKYLHVHHRTRVKYDAPIADLQVLCIGCHANQSGHGLMRALADFVEFSALARR